MNTFAYRKYIIGGLIGLVFLFYIGRLFYLQVIDSSYKFSASSNVFRYITQYPSRGLIFDRNGKMLVCNQAVYDVMVIPRQLERFDTLEFGRIFGIEKDVIKKKILEAKYYSRYKPSIFLKQVSSEVYAVFQEKAYKFPGFFVQARTLRSYPINTSAHLLGYVGEVDNAITQKDSYYKSGDYIGISGIESSYENYLRGKKGVSIFLVDVHNRIKGSYKNGEHDTLAVEGKNITLTIDIDLQQYGESLMVNKKGSIVAIEPETGEILALVTSPQYDPKLLVGRVRGENYKKLQQDTLKPLFNRALMAKYPPGSTFKLVNGLIALQENIINVDTRFSCSLGYHVGRFSLGCHNHPSPLDFRQSIQHSCNAYYCNVFRAFLDNKKFGGVYNGYQVWYEYVSSFGFGKVLGSDFANELRGNLPSREYYDRIYGQKRWVSLNIVSMAIGQGEVLATPLQIANFTATIANRGWYYVPHIIKSVQGEEEIEAKFRLKNKPKVDSVNYLPVIDGMEMATIAGTATIARIPNIVVCGKTGTAENPHGKDHSVFVAFAPKDKPKIAISVYVENAGFGASHAAPIASLIMEKYLTGSISRPWLELYVKNTNMLKEGDKKD